MTTVLFSYIYHMMKVPINEDGNLPYGKNTAKRQSSLNNNKNWQYMDHSYVLLHNLYSRLLVVTTIYMYNH